MGPERSISVPSNVGTPPRWRPLQEHSTGAKTLAFCGMSSEKKLSRETDAQSLHQDRQSEPELSFRCRARGDVAAGSA